MDDIFVLSKKIIDKSAFITKETSYKDSYIIADVIKVIQATDGVEDSEVDEETYSIDSIRDLIKTYVNKKTSLAERFLDGEKIFRDLNPKIEITPEEKAKLGSKRNKSTAKRTSSSSNRVESSIQIPPDTIFEELWSGDLYDETGESAIGPLRKDLESDLENLKTKKLVAGVVKSITGGS